MPSKNPFSCPVCGGDVPAKAKACPHCGACEKSGWNEDAASSDGLDLPGDDFSYEEFTAREFGSPGQLKGKDLFWKVSAVIVVILVILSFAISMFFR